MRANVVKVAVVASALLGAAVLWLCIAPDPQPGLPEAREVTDAGGARPEGRRDSPGEPSPRRSSAPGASRTPRERGASAREVARSESPGTIGSREVRETSSGGSGAQARDPGRSLETANRDRSRNRNRNRESDSESEEFGRFTQQLALLDAASRDTARGDPIDADEAGLSADDVGRIDLDGDGDIAHWELDRTGKLAGLAEEHAVRNDLDDGAYPIDRRDYKRMDWEFVGVDTNQDGQMDVEEYYSFVFDSTKLTVLLDSDGDWRISPGESGLSADDFAALDRDRSGSLKLGEVRRAIALGVLDRPAKPPESD